MTHIRYNLDDCPYLTPVDSWERARKQHLNKARLIKGVPCYFLQEETLYIDQRVRMREPVDGPPVQRRMTGRHNDRMSRLLYYNWPKNHPQIAATGFHAEVLSEEPGKGLVIRLIRRGYNELNPEAAGQPCWDLEEIKYWIPTTPVNWYLVDEFDPEGPVSDSKLGCDPLSASAEVLYKLCEQCRTFIFKYESFPFHVDGLRVGHRIAMARSGALEGGCMAR